MAKTKKEPWQMTKKEFISYPTLAMLSANEQRAAYRYALEYNAGQSKEPTFDEFLKMFGNRKWEVGTMTDLGTHKELIEQAIRSGKPVPPEVLKDYPDLQKQQTAVESDAWRHQTEAELLDRAREGSLSPHSTIHWDDETQKLFKRMLRQGKLVKVQKLVWTGPGNKYAYRLPGVPYDYTGEAMEDTNVASKQLRTKPLAAMNKSELKQLRVILRMLPDNTLWISEEDKDGLERTVASWNPRNRPDSTEKSLVGGYVLGEKVSDDAEDWLRTVSERFSLNNDVYVVEMWRGSGVRYRESPFNVISEKGTNFDLTGSRTTALATREANAEESSKVKSETSLQSIESSRSPLSQSSDERQEHSLVLEPDDPRVDTLWRRDPGKADVRGVDTPRNSGKKTKYKAGKTKREKTGTTVRGVRGRK